MQANQANVEYWFRLLYDCIHGACYGSGNASQFTSWLAHLWIWIIILGYALAVVALFIVIYCIIRLFELRKREEEYYSTLLPIAGEEGGVNPRWEHIESLMNSANVSEWREAVIEADIMLDDLLAKRGYTGDGVGEKLKSVKSSDLATLDEAWDAHKVRNQIAHQGSTFDLSDTLARRTLSRYEAVFREWKVL